MDSLDQIVDRYLALHPDERRKLERLRHLLATTADARARIARRNFVGHVTASGFVVDQTRKTLALVYHKGLAMYVQPGGHLEPTDNTPLDGARREIREEIGLTALTYLPVTTDPLVPVDIDSHYIPPNPSKDEAEHWHHDFRYLFLCEDVQRATVDEAEVAHLQWVALDALEQFPTFETVAAKIRDALQ